MPGGLDQVATQEDEEEEEEEDGWKTRAPGLKRGVQLEGAEEFLRDMLGQEALGGARRKKRTGWEDGELEVSKLESQDKEEWRGSKGVDDLLPIGVSLVRSSS
jgi:antiviral helicase SKI2